MFLDKKETDKIIDELFDLIEKYKKINTVKGEVLISDNMVYRDNK